MEDIAKNKSAIRCNRAGQRAKTKPAANDRYCADAMFEQPSVTGQQHLFVQTIPTLSNTLLNKLRDRSRSISGVDLAITATMSPAKIIAGKK